MEKNVGKKKVAAPLSEPKEEMLFLRTCSPGGLSYGGFRWPLEVGVIVTAPDWDPKPEYGNGLHGLKDGNGNANYLNWSPDAIWIVFGSDFAVDLDGKWKVKTAVIRAVGDRKTVTDFLVSAKRTGVHGGTSTSGDYGTSTSGDGGTSTSGHGGSLISWWWDGNRRRFKVGYIGENGLKPNTKYRLNDAHEFEEVK